MSNGVRLRDQAVNRGPDVWVVSERTDERTTGEANANASYRPTAAGRFPATSKSASTHKGHSCRSKAEQRHCRIANAELAGFYNLGDVMLLPMAVCTNCSTIQSKAFATFARRSKSATRR